MSTKAIQEALREAECYIGDESAGSMPFWRALAKAREELKAIQAGPSLRDTLAAQFMAARLANPTTRGDITDDQMASDAYQRADAFLRARTA